MAVVKLLMTSILAAVTFIAGRRLLASPIPEGDWLSSARARADLSGRSIPLADGKSWRFLPGDSLRAVVIWRSMEGEKAGALVEIQTWRPARSGPPLFLEGMLHMLYRRISSGEWIFDEIGWKHHLRLPDAKRLTAKEWRERRDVLRFIDRLRHALTRDDREAVAAMVHFPFAGHPVSTRPGGSGAIRDRAGFLALYDSIFAMPYRAGLMRSIFSKMTLRDAMASDGGVDDRCAQPGEYLEHMEYDEAIDQFHHFIIRVVRGRPRLYRVQGCS